MWEGRGVSFMWYALGGRANIPLAISGLALRLDEVSSSCVGESMVNCLRRLEMTKKETIWTIL